MQYTERGARATLCATFTCYFYLYELTGTSPDPFIDDVTRVTIFGRDLPTADYLTSMRGTLHLIVLFIIVTVYGKWPTHRIFVKAVYRPIKSSHQHHVTNL